MSVIDGDNWNEDHPCYGNKSERLSRWTHELNG